MICFFEMQNVDQTVILTDATPILLSGTHTFPFTWESVVSHLFSFLLRELIIKDPWNIHGFLPISDKNTQLKESILLLRERVKTIDALLWCV